MFRDGFESGGLGQWTSVTGSFTDQEGGAYQGSWAARADATGASDVSFARGTLPKPRTHVTYSVRVKVISLSSPVTLVKLLTASGATPICVNLDARGDVRTYNILTGGTLSPIVMSTGKWHLLRLVVAVNGTTSNVQVSLDGKVIGALSGQSDLGIAPITGVQLGNSTAGRVYDVAFDNVRVRAS